MVPVKANRQHEILSPLDAFSAYQQDYLDIYPTPEKCLEWLTGNRKLSHFRDPPKLLPQLFYGTLQMNITNGKISKISFSSANSLLWPTIPLLLCF